MRKMIRCFCLFACCAVSIGATPSLFGDSSDDARRDQERYEQRRQQMREDQERYDQQKEQAQRDEAQYRQKQTQNKWQDKQRRIRQEEEQKQEQRLNPELISM